MTDPIPPDPDLAPPPPEPAPVDTSSQDPDPAGCRRAHPDVATATDVLDVARSRLGTVGGAEFQHAHGASSGAWCAYFATWAVREAGVPDGPWTGWTPGLVTWALDRALWKAHDPLPGDLALMMWPTVSPVGRGEPPVCHVGVVESGAFHIEGNTAGIVGGSQYNGNTVARRMRTTNVVGYVDLQRYYATRVNLEPPATVRAAPHRLLEDDMVRIRTSTGGIYLVDVRTGTFRGLNPLDNSLFDRLKVPIVWDGLSPFELDQVRQLVRDHATPSISG